MVCNQFLICLSAVALFVPIMTEPVIVVGGGLAGLSATLEIAKNNGKVILIEAQPNTGGNSAKASSGINGAGTVTQQSLGIKDSPDQLIDDTIKAGDGENDNKLVQILAKESSNAVEFLKSYGVDLGDVNQCGGHKVARTHWVPSPKEGRPIPAGFEIMKRLKMAIDEKKDVIEVRTNTRMIGIVRNEAEEVIGIEVEAEGKREMVSGKAVVLTTGGFSADRESPDSLMVEFGKEKLQFPTSNGPFARGEGVKLARSIGAELVGMNRIQIHPTGFVDPKEPAAMTKFLAAEALRGKGAILINREGRRFGNELGRRDYMTKRILENSQPIEEKFQGGSGGRNGAIMLMSDKTADAFGRPAFNFYAIVKKFFKKYENADEISSKLGVDKEILRSTLDQYRKAAKGEIKDEFGKTTFPVEPIDADSPIYAAIITPVIHYTMGGLKIDENAQVINTSGKPIVNLFAAGEVSGGVHGSNRLAGNSLLECVVFGRRAGRSAAILKNAKSEL